MSLNLDNFEGEFARDTPYILTSPTSLKVCLNLDIQPTDLVYRSLEEYEETLCDLPLSEIYRIYEENETERQEKLLKCRDLRKSFLSKTMAISSQKHNNSSSTTSEDVGDGAKTEEIQSIRIHSSPSQKHSKNNDNKNKSNSTIRRYTSAPAVNKSQNVKHSVNFQRNNLKGSHSGSISARTRSRSNSGRRFCTSDTESTEGHLNTITIDNPYYNSRSVPDLTRSNLDFRKFSSSPRSHCPCHFEVQDREIFSEYIRKYGDIFESSPDLSLEDRRIMECLILKKGRQMEWERRSQELRKNIEKDRTQRWTESQHLMQSWHDQLSEKRRMESIENTKRYIEMQDKCQESRSNLMRYLEERDRRVQKYLEDMNYKKKKSLLEKQKREALRQLEVGKAIEKLVEEDRQHRQILRDKLQRRMEEADTRKRRREKDYYRHVSEMNRLEDIKRSVKLERLEQKTRESVEELKNQIEEKEHRARMNYLNRIRVRNRALSEGSGSRQKAMEKVHTIHTELLKGLEEWHKKVLELHLEAQKRAEMKYNTEIHRRRTRVASDRILREERSCEMLKKVHELEEQKKDLLKITIESKESKTAKIKADKERKVQISRIRAQHAAELRQQLKDKIDPETFDRKAARAEMELRIMKRPPPPGFSIKFNPKLISKRCSCSCNPNHRRSHNNYFHHGSASATYKAFGGPIKSTKSLTTK